MSVLDIDKLSPTELVTQYVLECGGHGLFLPYSDYLVIEEWLSAASHVDELLLVLSEVLPRERLKYKDQPKPVRLTSIRRSVLAKLSQRPQEKQDGYERVASS